MKKGAPFLFFLLLCFLNSFAQKDEIQFTHFSMKDGLSMNPVMSIIQDKKGFLWFGTQDGLNKYDGCSVKIFKADDADSSSISDNFITSQCVDDSGRLWIGTLNGLNMYDRFTGKFRQFRKSGYDFPNEKIYCLYQDNDGLIWIGAENGISLLDPVKQQFINIKTMYPGLSVLSQKTVLSIFRGSDGVLWFGTTSGLIEYTSTTGVLRNFYFSQKQDGTLSNNIVLCMYEDHSKNLWIGTLDGLNKFDKKDNSFTHMFFKQDEEQLTPTKKNNAVAGANIYSMVNNYVGNTIRCIHEDADGWLWIGTDMELIIYNPADGKFINYKKDLINPTGINDHFIRSIFADRSGNLWIGTLGSGLNKASLKPKKFTHYQKKINNPRSLSENYVRTFCEDDSGKIWIGTVLGGLNEFDPKTQLFTRHQKTDNLSPKSIGDNNVWSLYYDKEENGLWLGTNNGLDFFDLKSRVFTHYQHKENDEGSISDNTVRNVLIDSKGRLWCGTENGINLFDRKTKSFKSWNTQNSTLSNNTVWKIIEDRGGKFWLATNDGLNWFDPAKNGFTVFKKVTNDTMSLSHNGVRTLLLDKNYLWVGTQNGLNRLDLRTKKFQRYNEKHGLPSPFIYSIVEDRKGKLWISTNKGLSEFDKISAFRNYDIYDGLQDYEFNTNAGFITSGGEIYFGGPSGVNRFNPAMLSSSSFIPPVVITGIKVMDKEFPAPMDISELKEMTLPYDENNLHFSFAALDYTNPSRNRFMYKLEGFNKDWIMAGTVNGITYTNLDPNKYTFLVKGANADGVWNDEPAVIRITILPPFWKTWWFYLLCVAAVGAGIILYIRQRTRTLIRTKMILEKKVKERTVEVEAQKNELAQKNKDITDSISYAKRIQNSIVPGETVLKENFCDAFVLYKPRDIVSGDFYWYAQVHTSTEARDFLKIIAVIDCTGHGVPGAFMSIIANDLLIQTLKDKNVNSPADVLKFLNEKVPQIINRNVTEKIYDGMDMAVCAIDEKKMVLHYAGANRPLWKTNKAGELIEIVPTKASVGGYTAPDQIFKNHTIAIDEGDTIYLFTDGYSDQFGGPKNKKIGSRKFKEMLKLSGKSSLEEQRNYLSNFISEWKGSNEQIDDICVMGIRF